MSDLDIELDILLERLRRIPFPCDSSDEEDDNILPPNQPNINNRNDHLLNNNNIMANQFHEFYLRTIPEFDGEPANVSTFLSACNLVMNQFYDANNANLYLNHFLLNFVQSKLTGQARAIVNTKHITCWLDLKNVIISNFSDQRDDSSLLSELLTLKQKPNEDAMSFSNRCRHIEQLLISNLSINEADENTRIIKRQIYTQQTLKAFLGGLRNPLGMVVRSTNPQTIEAALKFIISEENYEYRDSIVNKNKNQNQNQNQYNNYRNQPKFFERPHVPKFQPVQFQRPFPTYSPPKPFPYRSEIPRVPHPHFQQQFQRQNFQRPNFQRNINTPSRNTRMSNYPQPMDAETIRSRAATNRNNNQPRNNFHNPNPGRLNYIVEELHNVEHDISPSEAYDRENSNFPTPGPSTRET